MNEILQVRRRYITCTLPVWPFQHCKMSLQAKGLLALLLSFPDNWEIRMNDIINRSRNGRDSTRKNWTELINEGYVQRVYVRENARIKNSAYIVYDEPVKSESPKDRL